MKRNCTIERALHSLKTIKENTTKSTQVKQYKKKKKTMNMFYSAAICFLLHPSISNSF